MNAGPSIVPDSEHKGLVAKLPPSVHGYALLARFDRPIGWWLLFWPCAWGVFLGGGGSQIGLVVWMLLGAIVMRGAGCVYNDIVDADLDRQVARTAARPIASGAISSGKAWLWLLALCAVGLVVLFRLPPLAQLVALGSIAPVAAYPFMKRITWWPQAWLGIVFTWGLPVGWIAITTDHLPVMLAAYAGAILWVIGYDTIYALQDREDDALVGIRSSARAMGQHVRMGVALLYATALGLWALSFWLLRPDVIALLALLPVGLHLGWQVVTLDVQDDGNALARFRSNRFAGLLMAAACYVVGNAGLQG